ncbi:hypothetical protein COV93_06345 [Candidatus Woesearchaeota archaeon CG11_big_fil_rev_8_21_14_0_20_43_8]|nr:MAG: hypothetical protein COV93_06345 [Candidatus Woesearchaeota archaeon CG11_big_fil_rev_8_21_14_0_20_43_8]PIO04697.1 MAG: hypothetical protein COT47_07960 [Candidatus Woesearchaeota archaeon CG08_land_8_20_14_0_20_43_7]
MDDLERKSSALYKSLGNRLADICHAVSSTYESLGERVCIIGELVKGMEPDEVNPHLLRTARHCSFGLENAYSFMGHFGRRLDDALWIAYEGAGNIAKIAYLEYKQGHI